MDRVTTNPCPEEVGICLSQVTESTYETTSAIQVSEPFPKLEGALGCPLRTVVLSRYDRNNITLGYCVTTHKAQGATVESSYVFSYGAMTDAQMAYVQASRARNETRIYTTKDEAGPELSDLAEAMSRSRKKTMAHDATEEAAPSAPKVRQGLRLKLCYERD